MRVLMVMMILSFNILACSSQKENNKQGLISKKSNNSVEITKERLKQVLLKNKDKGLGIALEWSHSQKALQSKSKIKLRPTELILFGNPNIGSHFFTSQQTAGIDLPMKVLIWQDEKDTVWLTYNDPQYIADRHGIHDREKVIQKMSQALNKMTDFAIQQNKG